MTMTLCEIIKEIFESEEMSHYLCEHVDDLCKWQIRKMVAASPTTTLQRKLEIFEWLAEQKVLEQELAEAEDESYRKWVLNDSYAAIAKNTRAALDALYDTTRPAVFLVENIVCHDNSDNFEKDDAILFASFEKAAAYIKAESKEFNEGARFWYNVEKWELDENGDMSKTFSYTIVNNQILFCYHPEMHGCEASPDLDVNLRVPFQSGDIIEVHHLPFAHKRHALILSVGDNWDCCSVQHVYVEDDGSICVNSLKHGHVLYDTWDATSPLYTARKYCGVLEDGEKVLALINDYMEKRPELDRDRELWKAIKYIEEHQIHSSDVTEDLLDSLVEKMLREKE